MISCRQRARARPSSMPSSPLPLLQPRSSWLSSGAGRKGVTPPGGFGDLVLDAVVGAQPAPGQVELLPLASLR